MISKEYEDSSTETTTRDQMINAPLDGAKLSKLEHNQHEYGDSLEALCEERTNLTNKALEEVNLVPKRFALFTI